MKALIFIIILTEISSSCITSTPGNSADECRSRQVELIELKYDCNKIYGQNANNCQYISVSDYMCCFVEIEYESGTLLKDCMFYPKMKIIENGIKLLKEEIEDGTYNSNGESTVETLDCNGKYLKYYFNVFFLLIIFFYL